MKARSEFGRGIFLFAGVYGLITLLPQYFLEEKLSRNFPPAITHPEQFYGFIGVALAWQFAFLVIARDVRRFRVFIVPAILEKLSFAVATFILFGRARVDLAVACAGAVDFLFAIGFILAFLASGRAKENS